MQEAEEDKRNRKIGMMVSAGLHALLFIAFLFILAWREPDPPLPEYGIQLNFGTSNVGTGEVQPETPSEPAASEEEAAPEEVPEETEVEPVPEAVPEETTEPVEEAVQTTPNVQESPQTVPAVKEEKPKPVVKEEKKVEEKKPETKPVETKKDPVKPDDGAKGKNGESNQPKNANQGDDTDAEGDKGDEQGSLDARALYGNPGGGGKGPALSIVGWTWDSEPNKKDNSNENGTIIFSFIIDENGDVLTTDIVESSVSPGVANFYREQLRNTTFSKIGSGVVTAPQTKGTVTFVIRSR